MTKPSPASQTDVARWFDRTYEKRGFGYLRPLEAYPIFLQLLNAEPGKSLLDVACGPGLLLRAALMRGLEATGVDISERAIEIARDYADGADARVGNVEELAFADGSFDYVTCVGALERFFDRDRALSEIRRVARPDAKFCFMVRNASTLVWRLWHQMLRRQNHEGHQDAQSLGWWTTLFRDNGFEVENVFMDQWGRQKLRRFFRGFRRHDFSKPEPVATPLFAIQNAFEFIFILRKRGD